MSRINTDHEVLIIRHAPANSNTGSPGGTDLSTMKLEEFARSVSDGDLELTNGDYLPDNLTEYGELQLESFVKHFSKCEGIDKIFCSLLPRSIQTARRISEESSIPVESIPGLRENTNWPQDIPPVTVGEDNRRFAYTLMMKGNNSGAIVGEAKIDVTVDGADWQKWKCPEQRLKMLTAIPSLDRIEEEDQMLRQDIRTRINEIARGKEGGPVKVAIVTHGGKINTLLGRYYTGYNKGDNGQWRWAASTAFRNLDVARFRFKSATDDQAELVELPQSDSYASILGSHYRHFGNFEYVNQDGSVINQRQGYKTFLETSAKEVRDMLSNHPILTTGLLLWAGSGPCLEDLQKKG